MEDKKMSDGFKLQLAACEVGEGNDVDVVACIVSDENASTYRRRVFHGHLFAGPVVANNDGGVVFGSTVHVKGDGSHTGDVIAFPGPHGDDPLRIVFTSDGERAYIENNDEGRTEDTSQPTVRLDPDKIEITYDEVADTLRLRRK
jgi:DNA-binding beta-propeller fold protein YncE